MFSFRNGVPASIIVVKMTVIAHPEIGSCEKCFGFLDPPRIVHCFIVLKDYREKVLPKEYVVNSKIACQVFAKSSRWEKEKWHMCYL